MPDSSEGTALPKSLSSTTLIGRGNAHNALAHNSPNPYDVDVAQEHFDEVFAQIVGDFSESRNAERLAAPVAALNEAHQQSGHSWSIPGQPPANVWTSRRYWLRTVSSVLKSEDGRALCKAKRVAPDTCYAIALALADFADSATGRSVTASNRRIGKLAAHKISRGEPFSHDTVSTARRILAKLGLAVEVARGRYLTKAERLLAQGHHGGNQTRAASVWALVSPRKSAARPYLPPRGFTPRKGSCTSKSPTRSRKRARAPFGRIARPNRPVAAQIVAAELVQQVPSLDQGHIGAIVDVVVDTVDYTRWTGRDLAKLINLAACRGGFEWPSKITRPAAFLRHRLRLLSADLAGPSPSEIARTDAVRIRAEQQNRAAEQEQAKARAAQTGTVRAAMDEFKAMLTAKRNTRRR